MQRLISTRTEPSPWRATITGSAYTERCTRSGCTSIASFSLVAMRCGGPKESSPSCSNPDLQDVVVRCLGVGHVDALQLDAIAVRGLLQMMPVRACEVAHVVAAQLHHV